jgi:hypothetical protein
MALFALPHLGAQPEGWVAAVARWGRASLTSLALEYLDEYLDAFHDLAPACFPGDQ